MLSRILSGWRFDMHLAVPRLLVRRSIMLLVSVALVAMTLIGLAGMSASFLVVDRSRDSVQAIDVASSLRGHTQRIANLIAIDALKGRIGVSERTRAAMADIERELQEPALRRFGDAAPGDRAAPASQKDASMASRSPNPATIFAMRASSQVTDGSGSVAPKNTFAHASVARLHGADCDDPNGAHSRVASIGSGSAIAWIVNTTRAPCSSGSMRSDMARPRKSIARHQARPLSPLVDVAAAVRVVTPRHRLGIAKP